MKFSFSSDYRSAFVVVVGALALAGCATKTPQQIAAKDAVAKVKPSVYFEFDRFDLKPEAKPTTSAFSNYLKSDSSVRITIEGNADERGTVEYNLALGQKRAEAVRKALQSAGVPAGQMEAVSNGEEKPRATGSNERAWAENRRADLIVK